MSSRSRPSPLVNAPTSRDMELLSSRKVCVTPRLFTISVFHPYQLVLRRIEQKVICQRTSIQPNFEIRRRLVTGNKHLPFKRFRSRLDMTREEPFRQRCPSRCHCAVVPLDEVPLGQQAFFKTTVDDHVLCFIPCEDERVIWCTRFNVSLVIQVNVGCPCRFGCGWLLT